GDGELIQELIYADNWFREADGGGYSLTIVDELAELGQWSLKSGWKPSAAVGGTPGRVEAPSGDFSGEQRLDAADIDLFCGGLRRDDAQFDLTGDLRVDRADLERLILDAFGTTFGDASLDGVFNSRDLV